jgi:hypothetical protein
MPSSRIASRRASSLVALVIAGVSTALGSALPASAANVTAPAVHGMGARQSPVTLVTPTAGLRSLSTIAAPAITLPAAVDLSRYADKVGDQGSLGSCATWAIGYAMMGWFARSQGHAGAPYAPMYVYSQVNGGRDAGSYPVDILEVIRTQGIDTAADYAKKHTWSTLDWRRQPSAAERAVAARNKITGWVTLYNTYNAPGAAAVTAVKRTLASGRPVALGISVYSGFMNAYGPGSFVTSVGRLGAVQGYHEVLALGYDSRGVRIQNSWGTSWGDRGYAILDWNYIAQHSFEAETIGGLATTTGVNRPVIATVSAPTASAGTVTVTGTKLNSAMITFGATTFAPAAISADGRQLTFQVPVGAATSSTLSVSTPGGVSAARTYRYVR